MPIIRESSSLPRTNPLYNWVRHLWENNPEISQWAENLVSKYYAEALAWVNNNLVPQLQVAVQAVTGGVVGMLVFFKNILLGVPGQEYRAVLPGISEQCCSGIQGHRKSVRRRLPPHLEKNRI